MPRIQDGSQKYKMTIYKNGQENTMLDNLTRVMNEFANEIVAQYKDNLSNNDHIASGKLRDSITFNVRMEDDYAAITINLEDYWKYIENGRGPGRFPPPDKILQWIRVKNILPTEINGKLPTEKQLAYLIGRKISEKGYKGTEDFKTAKDTVENIFIERMKLALVKDFDEEAVKLIRASGIMV